MSVKNILTPIMVPLALALGALIMLFIAALPIASSISADLQSAAVTISGFLGLAAILAILRHIF